MTIFTVVERLWRGEDVAGRAGRAGRAPLCRVLTMELNGLASNAADLQVWMFRDNYLSSPSVCTKQVGVDESRFMGA